MKRAVALALLVVAAACGSEPTAPTPARTTLTPPPGPFNGKVTVEVTTDAAAQVFVTLDGSDPRASPTRQVLTPPTTLELEATTTVSYYSRTARGADEEVRSGSYVRAGGPRGTATGVVVVGGYGLDMPLALVEGERVIELGAVRAAGEVPFVVDGLDTGSHTFVAMLDRDRNGQFQPLLDLQSKPVTFTLDLEDPFKASAEDLRLYVAASQPGHCTIRGTVTLGAPVAGLILTVSPLDPAALSGDIGDLTGLSGLLSIGYGVTTNGTDTRYPFVMSDLAPGTYLVVPALTGGDSLSLNLLLNLLGSKECKADTEVIANFDFGSVSLSGTVTVTPATTPQQAVRGIVAARNVALLGGGIQAVLMPAAFTPGEQGTIKASLSAVALRDNANFDLRTFTSLDPTDPFTAAFAWLMNPLTGAPAHARVKATPPKAHVDFTVPAPAP